MRVPRSEAPIAFASAAASVAPSAILLKISSSIAAFSASACWYPVSVAKIRSGDGFPLWEGVAIVSLLFVVVVVQSPVDAGDRTWNLAPLYTRRSGRGLRRGKG